MATENIITKYLDDAGLSTLVGQIKANTPKVWKGTKQEYDDLTEYDPQTLYCIIGETVSTPVPVQSDWNEKTTTSLAYIKNKPTLKIVATTGDYNDLENKPDVPTKVSDLDNDSNYATEGYVSSTIEDIIGAAPGTLDTLEKIADKLADSDDIHTAILSGLSEKATITQLNEVAAKIVQSDWNVTSTTSNAFIKNKPTIPTKTSQLTNDSDYITSDNLGTNVNNMVADTLEMVMDKSAYDAIINTTDGLINTLNDYICGTNITKSDFIARADQIKFVRISNSDGTRSTVFNVTFTMPKSAIVCVYNFNKLDGEHIGIGYVTIRYNDSTHLKITSIRSTMFIDGQGPENNGGNCGCLTGAYTEQTSWASLPIDKKVISGTFTSNVTLGLSGSIPAGEDITLFMRNTSSDTLNITMTAFTYRNVNTLEIPAGKMAEINIMSDGQSTYVRGMQFDGGTGGSGSGSSTPILALTQSEYDSLGTPNANTLYLIKE